VNGLKDLCHVTDTHFVVSVSEDALDSFALRGVPVRDVFDSSFDTVMRIRPFTAARDRRWAAAGPDPCGPALRGPRPREQEPASDREARDPARPGGGAVARRPVRRLAAGDSTARLEGLSAARAAMAVSRVDALGRLGGARASFGLPELAADLVDQLNTVVAVTLPEAVAAK
jgi:hypothetical protein